MASRNGTSVDSTTQAGYFRTGLKRVILSKLQGTVSPEVMSDMDLLIDAAEKVEANLEVSRVPHEERGNGNGSSNGNGNGRGRGQNNQNAGRVQGNYVQRTQHNNYRPAPYQPSSLTTLVVEEGM